MDNEGRFGVEDESDNHSPDTPKTRLRHHHKSSNLSHRLSPKGGESKLNLQGDNLSPNQGISHSNTAHNYREDGLLVFNPAGSHPVYDLIKTSKAKWMQKLDKASATIEQAVAEYRRRYRRMPPKGFEKWWRYAVEHQVQLPDEYDQIHNDLEPFWGLRPSYVIDQQRKWEAEQEVGSYTITSESGHISFGGHSMPQGEEDVALNRAAEQMGLLREVEQWLPDFRATFTAHDVPYQFLGHGMKWEAAEHASMSEYLDPAQAFESDLRGWSHACSETSALRQRVLHSTSDNKTQLTSKTFIWDHKHSMDPCHHADHVQLNGFLNSHDEGPVPRKTMVPSFSMCTTQLHADILTVAMEMWTEDIGEDPPWESKQSDRLLWRGSNTGIFFGEDGRWNQSQRVRLVRTANLDEGFVEILTSTTGENDPVGPPQSVPLATANDQFMDIAFAGNAIQCAPAVCSMVERTLLFEPRQSFDEAYQWKYIMDIDGNGWSSRFKRLMTSRSLIFKSTIFPEWYADRIQPWVHYVPIQNDLSDLYDVFAFFHGDTNGDGSHDDLAEAIASAGRDWSLRFWRKEDMVAYMFRLMLEYARVMSPDREAATFSWDDVRSSHDA